ncbi:hypothetical protein GW17_00058584 [Ensete ventricosum]|nr:hypothetical protein GW17_00058584 [Ensete ventricosum]RZS27285.1 hypothetical protein BHM03_00060732 [Ensete ventricosum]
MALQPRIIACGNSVAAFAMAVRFLTGPAVMAAASIAVGLRGVLLRIAIVQVPSSPLPFHLHRSLPSDTAVASLFFFLLLRWRWPGLRAGVTPARHRPFRVCQGVQFACRYPQHSVSTELCKHSLLLSATHSLFRVLDWCSQLAAG